MNKQKSVTWSRQSLTNARKIKAYLREEFSEKEVANFEDLLKDFEKTLVAFYRLYPKTKKHNNLRKAVLNKFLSVYYKSSKR